jgi:delta-aminolevulinic acid dehydratase/porphobilinogen synthase
MYCQAYRGKAPAVSRRVSNSSEVELQESQFGQPIDIELTLPHGERELPNMPGYPRRSLGAALAYIHQCTQIGLAKFLIRIVEGGDQAKDTSFAACMNRLKRQADTIDVLRQAYPSVALYVDPFGLALGKDDQWGATNGNGELSLNLTEQMFAQAVEAYAKAGASYVLTLGRFPREVEIARAILTHVGSAAKICTFSTNTETSQAYAYLAQHEIYRDSSQKVLPQNVGEMMLWALLDIMSGANQVIIKPSDNFHVLLRLIQLAHCAKSREKFLNLPTIAELVTQSEFFAVQVEQLRQHHHPLEAEWGSYAISGVYAQDMVVKERKGEAFLLTLLFERFVSIASTAALCGQSVTIFDRNAALYLAAE